MDIGEEDALCLLRSVYAPLCTRLKIHTRGHQDDELLGPTVSDYLVEKADVIFPGMFPITTSLSFVSWKEVSKWRCRLLRSEDADKARSLQKHLVEAVTFSLNIIAPCQPWTFLHEFYKRYTTNVPLSVEARGSQFFPQPNLFFQLTTVTDLTLSDYVITELEDMLLDYLAVPHVRASSTTWLLPNLKFLKLLYPSDTTMLTQFIKQRYVDMQPGICPPERLQKLVLRIRRDQYDDFSTALQPIDDWLGEDVLVIDFQDRFYRH